MLIHPAYNRISHPTHYERSIILELEPLELSSGASRPIIDPSQ